MTIFCLLVERVEQARQRLLNWCCSIWQLLTEAELALSVNKSAMNIYEYLHVFFIPLIRYWKLVHYWSHLAMLKQFVTTTPVDLESTWKCISVKGENQLTM